jgi:hypothetical protein
MTAPLERLSYIDPEQLQMLQELMKAEREALEEQLKAAFKGMKYVPERIQEKVVMYILVTDSLKHVPPKEKNKMRSKVLRILRFIQAYEMQDGKNIDELEAKLDEYIQAALITYKRDHRENIIGGAGTVPGFGGSDLGEGSQYAEQASLTDELQRGKYQQDMKNVNRQIDDLRRENDRLRTELQTQRKSATSSEPEFKDDPDED